MILSHDSLGRHPLQVLARMEIQTVPGIPDKWLSTYYGSGGSSSWADFDPSADEDGDGLSRLAEAAKGTDPIGEDAADR